jgi:gluconokinase
MSERGQGVVVMGVSGAGKTTVGQALARRLGWRFIEGDTLHPEANREKLARGEPLTDADRAPWLERVRDAIHSALAQGENVVCACSALKGAYRQVLGEGLRFVLLEGSPKLLRERLAQRKGHFANPSLLSSQLATLEPPGNALRLDVADSPEALVEEIVSGLHLVR